MSQDINITRQNITTIRAQRAMGIKEKETNAHWSPFIHGFAFHRFNYLQCPEAGNSTSDVLSFIPLHLIM